MTVSVVTYVCTLHGEAASWGRAGLPGTDWTVLAPKAGKTGEALAAGCVRPNPKPVLGVAETACWPKLKPPAADDAGCDCPKPKLVLGMPNAGADCGAACCPKAGVVAAWP